MAQPTQSLVSGATETPAIRCKTCKVPLPDASRKNCERCRRIRTENYHRWQRSVEARKNQISLPTPETSSAPPSNVNPRSHPASGTLAQHTSAVPTTSTAPTDHHPNERSLYKHSSQLPGDAPGPMSSLPNRIDIPEYQWGEELVDALLALPPRSNFFGQFSVVADPDVDNFKRARMFLDQVGSKGLPVSEAQRPVPRNPSASHGHAIGLYCTCEIGCRGRFVVSVDDDNSHPHNVPGQRIGVALLHSSSR